MQRNGMDLVVRLAKKTKQVFDVEKWIIRESYNVVKLINTLGPEKTKELSAQISERCVMIEKLAGDANLHYKLKDLPVSKTVKVVRKEET